MNIILVFTYTKQGIYSIDLDHTIQWYDPKVILKLVKREIVL